MTTAAPDSPEQARASAIAAVARHAKRRPVVVSVVVPMRADAPQSEGRAYRPQVPTSPPAMTWEESIRGPRDEVIAMFRRAWAASAGVAPCDVAAYSGRDARLDDADDYLAGPR